MGYMFVLGDCVRCHQRFTFNADAVPSVRINGEREPICRECFESLNRIRESRGEQRIALRADAYEAQEVD